jgi:Cu/Ag efflux protein CusF
MKLLAQAAAIGSAVAVCTGLARAELAAIQWSDSGASAHEFHVTPGKFAEWCGKLRAGDKVAWHFDAALPLDFNIHYHEGKDVRFPAKHDSVAKAGGTLDVAVAQHYCWMWTNKSGAPALVKASLDRGPQPTATPADYTDGEVIEVDPKQGTVVLNHREIRNLGMDAMAMEFSVRDRAFLAGLKKGDKVRFKAIFQDRRYVLVEIQRRR